ncbi:hypothetical protein [Herbiconiux flava]|uniref:Head-to-tail adaptor n=1 Tax=Herbiconiux flava TaxID=881268 RepID=A0A852STV8_9MICO|nr:hypothetical protein [Herbiconiux flava]NYD72297.1 hypothetical protein [Herbiconiux flava]GLK17740.1 hypothetical protein GCM10017602_22220 [Herbiconiux flava]
MPKGEWYDEDSIREVWADAPLDVEVCELIVDSALEEVQHYLSWKTGDPVLARHRLGQLQHTKNLWNAQRVSPGGTVGEGDFVITPHPLDWSVKQRLNPKSNVPVIG